MTRNGACVADLPAADGQVPPPPASRIGIGIVGSRRIEHLGASCAPRASRATQTMTLVRNAG